MKILFDHQAFTYQRYGGVSRYFAELFKNLNLNKTIIFNFPKYITKNEYIKGSQIKNYHIRINFRGFNRFAGSFNRNKSISYLKNTNYDLFHPTYYDPYFIKYLSSPYVLTVHDLTHEKYQNTNYFKDIDIILTHKYSCISKAERIIAVSNNTKNDLIAYYNVDPNKIDVIYHGVSLNEFKYNLNYNYLSKENYILYVGNREHYKNFSYFINESSQFIKKNNFFILCAGGSKFSEIELNTFRKLNIESKIKQVKISNDEHLSHLYKFAFAFIFPSLYEGFGIPILEAFVSKCPVILSNKSSLPEVGGDSALYFNPEKEDSLNDALYTLLEDKNLRKILIEKGVKRINNFTWSNTAENTFTTYKKIIT